MGAKVLREVRLIFPVGEGLSSTGRDSVNQPDDVTALQDALNDLLPNEGGPIDPLAVTGIMDLPTGQAIRRFQKMHFGWQDGVVDPRQKTLQKLNEMRRTPMSPLDTTLNPSVLYAEGQFQGDLFNFGQLSIDEDGALTFRIVDRDGEEQYTLTLEPEGAPEE